MCFCGLCLSLAMLPSDIIVKTKTSGCQLKCVHQIQGVLIVLCQYIEHLMGFKDYYSTCNNDHGHSQVNFVIPFFCCLYLILETRKWFENEETILVTNRNEMC